LTAQGGKKGRGESKTALTVLKVEERGQAKNTGTDKAGSAKKYK